MKIINNVQMLAQGGASAWAGYIPLVDPSPTTDGAGFSESLGGTSNTTKADADGSIGLLDKNMVKFIYENGLPSDVESFISQIDSLSNGIHSSLFGPTSTTSQYKLILGLLPRLRTENERFKNALTAVEKNGGMNEIAVTSSGRVLVQDSEGNIDQKYLTEVGDSEQILTNGYLANLRANNKSGAFNTDLTNVIQNGIGMPAIQSYLQGVIGKIGSQKLDMQGYIGKDKGQIVKGLELLKQMNLNPQDIAGVSVDGLYKISNMSNTQKDQAKEALSWLWQTLPANMRTVLQSKARNFGDNSAAGAQKLLISLINSSLENELKLHADLESGYDGKGNKVSTTKDGSKDGNELGPVEALLSGFGDNELFRINVGGSNSIQVRGNSSLLVDSSGNAIQRGTLEDARNGQFSTLNWDSATMGGEELNSQLMHKVALDGNRIVAIDAPIDIEKYNATGVIAPDLDMLRRKEEADKEILEGNIKDPQQMNAIYEKYKLPIVYDENGELNFSNYRRFAVISAFADESAFINDPSMSLLKEVEDPKIRAGIERTLKAADKEYSLSSGIFGIGGTELYQGSVYIPMSANPINASLGSKNYYKLPKMTAQSAQEEFEQNQIRQSYVKTPSLSILGNA